MTKIKAVGHLRTELGEDEIEIEKVLTVKDVLDEITTFLLKNNVMFKLSRTNTLIIVNGVEISALNGESTLLKSDDEVVLVPVSHGG